MFWRNRWQTAQKQEKEYRARVRYTTESISSAKQLWNSMLETVYDSGIAFSDSQKILDVGSAGTSIFLELRTGQKYAVDPLFDYIFEINPFLSSVEEYKDVYFVTNAIEDAQFDFKFNTIFLINLLDHTKNIQGVADKVKNLLAPDGCLIITIDTYTSRRIRDVIRFFDPDPAHPHHLVKEDIEALFPDYKLIKYADNIHSTPMDDGSSSRGGRLLLKRIMNLPLRQVISYLRLIGMAYAIKHIICYVTLVFLYLIRRVELPVSPLNIRRLFVFRASGK